MPRDGATGPGPLPAALQPWHAWLQWFEPELAAQLGTLVQRLHPLLGRFHGRLQAGAPEPDGLGDLRPRGPYERLLASEWLLADDLPDEFLRRAAMGEHLFLAPRPRGRQAERLIVALFDAGPLQLGAPRLAHLALWILLARRALGAGGELRWGLLQAPGELHEAHGVQHLQQLLRGRSFVPGDASHWARWGEVLAAQAAPAAECWVIGSALLPQAASLPTHRVSVRRSLSGEALEVALAERHAERALRLPVPPAAAACALLRGAFDGGRVVPGRHQRPEHRLSLQRAPLFSPRGNFVAVPLLDEPGVAIFPVPRMQDPKAGAPTRQTWSAHADPLAVFFGGKQIAGVLGNATHLTFWHLLKFGTQPRPPREEFHAPPGATHWLPAAWLRYSGAERVCVVDQSARLVSWQVTGRTPRNRPDGAGAPRCVDTQVLGLAQHHGNALVYAVHVAGHVELRRLGVAGDPSPGERLGEAPQDAVVRFAGGELWSRGIGACAVRLRAGPQEAWRIHQPRRPAGVRGEGGQGDPAFSAYDLEPPPGWQVAGLVRDPQSGGFALLAQAPDRLALHRIGPRSRESVFTAPSRVLRCSVCPNTGLVAMLTAQRQFIVQDPAERAVRLFVHAAASEDAHAEA